jgi:hypothetical protein
MPTTRSYTRAEANWITPTIQARRVRSTSTISENPPFRLRYSNPPPNLNIDPLDDSMPPPRHPPIPARRRIVNPPRGCIEEVSEEPSEQPEAPGDPVMMAVMTVEATMIPIPIPTPTPMQLNQYLIPTRMQRQRARHRSVSCLRLLSALWKTLVGIGLQH